MRGKVIHTLVRITVYRITPAYAGKSVKTNGKSATERGSPPPMRGKVVVSIRGTGEGRITPAYAGKRVDVPEVARSM